MNQDDEELSPEDYKVMESFIVFNSHFAEYIKQSDPNLFNRAIDYAKTFTEEDVTGIKLKYVDKSNDQNPST
jgi:hypothetical protein